MDTTRRGFFGRIAGAVAAALAWRQIPESSMQHRQWSMPWRRDRVYFSQLHDPQKWPELPRVDEQWQPAEYGYTFDIRGGKVVKVTKVGH